MGKASPSSRAISRTRAAVSCRCGSPPAPPDVPMMQGMRAATAACSISRRSRLTERREQNDVPAPR